MTSNEEELRAQAEKHGQQHVFAFWNELDLAQKAELLRQVEEIDFELVNRQGELLERVSSRSDEVPQQAVDFNPPELVGLDAVSSSNDWIAAARAEGSMMLARGEVACLLVAGGQASRLGYDGPKGAFPVGPVSGRTLFDFHARRLRAAQERYGATIAWYVMTSPANDRATKRIFETHDYFGLSPDHVSFFAQAMIPALDLEGRILMARKDALFLAPNGHGGTLSALVRSGCLADARARGVRVFSYFQVDNPLVRPADPLFLGLHHERGARMSSKVVSKRDAAEKVGVIGLVNGRLGCIEYSDLPHQLREARNDEGQLLFRAGNIAAHLLDLEFIEELTQDGLELPWHIARKSMEVLTPSGRLHSVAGAKFETFIFDALERSPRSVTLEVDRALEFSPVKNASGEDSPQSVRRDLCQLFGGWVARAGRELPPPDASGVHPVEIDPLLAEDEESFQRVAQSHPTHRPEGHLYERR